MPKLTPRLPGLLSVADLRKHVRNGTIDTVLVVFTDHYGRFMGKRFDATFFLDSALEHGAEACNYLLTVDMEMNPVPGYALASWELGYGDFHLRPDLRTLRATRTHWLLSADLDAWDGDAQIVSRHLEVPIRRDLI